MNAEMKFAKCKVPIRSLISFVTLHLVDVELDLRRRAQTRMKKLSSPHLLRLLAFFSSRGVPFLIPLCFLINCAFLFTSHVYPSLSLSLQAIPECYIKRSNLTALRFSYLNSTRLSAMTLFS